MGRARPWLAAAVMLLTCTTPAPSEPRQLPTDDWQRRVGSTISDAEYRIRPGADGWEASNRAQGLRARWNSAGVSVQPRTQDTGPSVQLKLVSWGRQSLEPMPPARFEAGEPRSDGAVDVDGTPLRRIVASHGLVKEWWENRAEGLEHGFTIERAPEGHGPVRLALSVDGAQATVEGEDGVTLEVTSGARWRYAGLKAWDATQQPLRAWFEVRGATLALVVDDARATYPVQVDPLLTTAAWTADSNQTASYFGVSVASAGDVNGDGYGDVIVGAAQFDNGELNEGRALVYLGSVSGLSTTAAWTAESDQPSAEFGSSVASAGDVNGDGFGDVIVGAPLFSNGSGPEGRAFVYLGSASGLSAAAAWTATRTGNFGSSVASAGDINGDGYSDVIVGAYQFSNGQSQEGGAFVFSGSASGLSTTPVWTGEPDLAGSYFGYSVASAGDVNGDGFGDVIVGAPLLSNGELGEGRAYVYLGSASSLAQAPAWTVESDQADAWFGKSVASAGDVNGDGFSDVIVGADRFDNGQMDEGRALLYQGSASGLSPVAAWTAESDQVNGFLGRSVASAGDVNADGYSDVIVGAPAFSNGESAEGRASVYLGSASGLSTVAAWTAEPDQQFANFGTSVASAGDVNGDGVGDVIIGAPFFSTTQPVAGQASVYLGAASGLSPAASWAAESDQVIARFGFSVASAGDVNGDGYGDVIVGAYLFDNGETDEGRAFLYLGSAAGLSTSAAWTAESDQAVAWFGNSVASAGDVNGDGYGDVIVGARAFDNGQTDEGRALVYLGSASGLSPVAAWTAEPDQTIANFGVSVASAGDVNGDGFGDVIVGASLFSNGEISEGRAFVYLGAASGLSTTAAWTAESDQTYSDFGFSVASAGDVNGDGLGDVIVGAWSFSNGQTSEGRAFVYLGAASGLSAVAAWTAESDQADARFGRSVASAGDVNGDGFGDVVVGAYLFSNGQTGEGRAFVYLGSTAGLSTTAAWTAESDQTDAWFGNSVASAGDVNGDGWGDVVVGAPLFDNGQTNEGRVFVFLGSAAGLSPGPAWIAESDQAGALLGSCVASAGDVTGDGYGDVIVGAPFFANGQADEGGAWVYRGNGQDGTQSVELRPQATQRGVATPIAPGGLLRVSANTFDLGLTARLPVGRARVKLQAELKPLGVPFDGLGLIRSPAWLDTGTGGTRTQLTFSSLAPSTAYHWRARLLADPSQGAPMTASRWLVGGISGQPTAVHVRTSALDGGSSLDAGLGADAGASADAGLDAGTEDAGTAADAGTEDAGAAADAGTADAGTADAGEAADAGTDAGALRDAGPDGGGDVGGGPHPRSLVGCGCSPGASAPGVWWLLIIGLSMLARRRPRSAPPCARWF